MLFPDEVIEFECVKSVSGVSDQPMSGEEMLTGAHNRIAYIREQVPDADYFIALEGGAEQMHGGLYNFGWVVAESKAGKRGQARTSSFALPPAIARLMLEEGMEQSPAMDMVLGKQDTKLSTGTIGPLTNDALTYTDWYVHAVVSALVPFLKMEEWTAWMKAKGGVVDMGAPLGKTKKVTPTEVTDMRNEIGGYSIVEAESHDEAARKMQDSPHFKMMPGGWIEVMEVMPM